MLGGLLALAVVACTSEPPLGPGSLEEPVPPPLVDPLLGSWEELDGTRWLLPDLAGVVVHVPDRPHAPDEVDENGRVAGTSVRRVRSFTVSTTPARLRSGVPPEPEGLLILALGDATTFGWGVDGAQAWPARLAAGYTDRGERVRVVNAGVPGAQVRDLARWCEVRGPALNPDWILWSAKPHPNDRPPFDSYLNSLRRCHQATGARVLVSLPPVSRFDLEGERTRGLVARVLADRVQAAGHGWMDLTDALRTDQGASLARVAGDLELRLPERGKVLDIPESGDSLPRALLDLFETDPTVREHGFFDQWHPDARGHDRIAQAVAKALQDLQTGNVTAP